MAQTGNDGAGKRRAIAFAATAALHCVGVAALIAAFGVDVAVRSVAAISTYDIALPAPPPPVANKRAVAETRRPPAAVRKVRQSPPPPTRPGAVAAPTPIAMAPAPRAPSSGSEAGPVATGAGAGGPGAGAAAGGGIAVRAEKVAGELRTSDFPRSGADARDGRAIVVRFTVGTDGRAANCRVVQSSGSAQADAITCRLIEKRFRYRPARDFQGTPVPDQTGWKQWWWRPS